MKYLATDSGTNAGDDRMLQRALEDLERQTHALNSAYHRIDQLEQARASPGPQRLGFDELPRVERHLSQLPPRIEKAGWACEEKSLNRLAPLDAYPGFGSASLLVREHATIGYIIEGRDAGKIESFVLTVYAAQRSRKNFSPVFITSCEKFRPFFVNNYIFEYIPPRADFAPNADGYEEWRQGRIDHFTRKWGITDFITYDSEAATRMPLAPRTRPSVVVYPDYGNGNPYIEMMYVGMRDDFDIVFGDPEKATQLTPAGPVIFHLHWEDAVIRTLREDATPVAMAAFVAAIDQLKAQGGSFFWTIHNLEPHDIGDRELSLEFSRQLLMRADRIHVHDQRSAEALRKHYGADRDIVVIEHPSYQDRYPPKFDRSLARRSLDFEIGDNEQMFLCFGQIRRYKGVATLMNVAPQFAGRAKFVIAGRSGRYDPRHAPPENCIAIDGHIDDETLSALFSAADFAVLPFEEITASGSLLLALSFGVPVIAPAHDSVVDIVRDGHEGFLYSAKADGAAISPALQKALDTPRWRRDAMEQSAAAAAAFRSPQAFAQAVRQMFDQELTAVATIPGRGAEACQLSPITKKQMKPSNATHARHKQRHQR